MSRVMNIVCLGLIMLHTVGCEPTYEPRLKVVEPQQPIPLSENQQGRCSEFKKIVSKIPFGSQVGSIRGGYTPVPITWDERDLDFIQSVFPRIFYRELKKANYPVTGNPDALFEDILEKSPDLIVGATITDVNQTAEKNVWTDRLTVETYLKLNWQIYSRRINSVLYETDTEAYGRVAEHYMQVSIRDIYETPLVVATKNLLADPNFHALVVRSDEQVYGDSVGTDTLQKDAAEPVKLEKIAESTSPIKKTVTAARMSVVTITRGSGHGSGFLISRKGHVLTNHHVVGRDRFLTVKLATGRELIGEVIRKSTKRDVALIKVEEEDMVPLPVRQMDINIGNDVYAIGTPLDKDFSTTLSRGIVSGFRIHDELRYMQSDVNVLPGSSGGPLLDSNGNVVGISAMMIGIEDTNIPSGFNFFIPIQDALDALKIELLTKEEKSD